MFRILEYYPFTFTVILLRNGGRYHGNELDFLNVLLVTVFFDREQSIRAQMYSLSLFCFKNTNELSIPRLIHTVTISTRELSSLINFCKTTILAILNLTIIKTKFELCQDLPCPIFCSVFLSYIDF